MELGAEVLERAGTYESMSRWEKSELGRELRRLGLSYGEIMELIPVKKSTLATWCREIRLTEEQVASITTRTAQPVGQPRDTQRKRRLEVAELRRRAEESARLLLDDPGWIAGVVLYWAEGGKSRNDLKLANTDPNALRFFVSWIRRYLNPDARFSMQLHLHEGNHEPSARAYWRAETGLVNANFYKTFIKPKGTGHRKNHLPHGVCTVRMRECADAWQTTMRWVQLVSRQLGLTSRLR